MQLDRLAELIEKPEVHKQILKGYSGGYSLGITSNPRNENEFAIRLRIQGENYNRIPSVVMLDGEPIPIVVNTNFTIPEPQ